MLNTTGKLLLTPQFDNFYYNEALWMESALIKTNEHDKDRYESKAGQRDSSISKVQCWLICSVWTGVTKCLETVLKKQ